MTELMERTDVTTSASGLEGDPRAAALARLNKKRDFRAHLLAYILVNAFLWLIWAIVFAFGGPSFPWPVFPLFGWGIGLSFHAWDAYGRRPFSEEEIERELARQEESR